jgi:hypothetical protein
MKDTRRQETTRQPNRRLATLEPLCAQAKTSLARWFLFPVTLSEEKIVLEGYVIAVNRRIRDKPFTKIVNE